MHFKISRCLILFWPCLFPMIYSYFLRKHTSILASCACWLYFFVYCMHGWSKPGIQTASFWWFLIYWAISVWALASWCVIRKDISLQNVSLVTLSLNRRYKMQYFWSSWSASSAFLKVRDISERSRSCLWVNDSLTLCVCVCARACFRKRRKIDGLYM